MLKNLPSLNLNEPAKVKCGEIFAHTFTDYTIYCTFCDMKSFKFEDFLIHIQNVHFTNQFVKTERISAETNEFLEVNVKNEAEEEDDRILTWDDLEQSYDEYSIGDYDGYNNDDKEFSLRILKTKVKAKKRRKIKEKSVGESVEEDNDVSLDNDFKPTKNETPASVNVKIITAKNYQLIKTPRGKKLKKTVKKKEKEVLQHTCSECKEIFLHLKQLDSHVSDYHNGYKCCKCNKRLRGRPALVRHQKTCTAEKKFTCPVEDCGRGFIKEEYLKRHLEVHTMNCTFICDFGECGKAFQTQRRLTIHTFAHRKSKKLVCDVCGYSCISMNNFKIHERVHTGEKPYGCEVCKKHFKSKAALTEHMLTHSTARPHVCEICNATFANPRILVRHRYIHTAEKTFKCKLCESAFKHPNSLDGHIRRIHRRSIPKKSEVTITSS